MAEYKAMLAGSAAGGVQLAIYENGTNDPTPYALKPGDEIIVRHYEIDTPTGDWVFFYGEDANDSLDVQRHIAHGAHGAGGGPFSSTPDGGRKCARGEKLFLVAPVGTSYMAADIDIINTGV